MIRNRPLIKFVLITLADLLQRIRHELFNTRGTTKSTVTRTMNLTGCAKHLARLLKKKTPSDVSIESILSIEFRFARWLRRRGLTSATIHQQVMKLRALIRYAKRLGYKHGRFLLEDQWAVIPQKARKMGLPAIISHAVENKIAPADFTRRDLDSWCSASVAAGKSLEKVEHQRKHFSYAIRKLGLLKVFRKFDAEKTSLPRYRLRVNEMPPHLRADVLRIIQWAQREQASGRLKGRTTQPLKQNLEMLCGYGIRVKGMLNITRVDQLLSKTVFRSYTSWLVEKRGCSRTSVVNALGAIHSVVLRHNRFDNDDFGWWKDILDEIDPELQSEVDERRRARQARFEDLAAIPDRIRLERLNGKQRSRRDAALLARDELIMRFLVKAVMAPVCVRRATLSNIRRAPVPLDDPSFAVSDWAKELLKKDPNLELWQFSFSPKETPKGKAVHGLILREIVAPLEEYLRIYRPILLGSGTSDSLFIGDSGGTPLTAADLTSLIKLLTKRYASVGVTPSSIKGSFIDYWLEKYPDGYVDLSNILWMEYTSVRQAYDPDYQSRLSGKAAG